jgi:hypothetical protein
MVNWKTTALGVATILVAIGKAAMAFFDNDPLTVIDPAVTIGMITVGWGLIMAKDAGVTGTAK